jgi:hypothetical protein
MMIQARVNQPFSVSFNFASELNGEPIFTIDGTADQSISAKWDKTDKNAKMTGTASQTGLYQIHCTAYGFSRSASNFVYVEVTN